MESRGFWDLGQLSDVKLRRELGELLASSCRVEARIVAHLAEVDRRKLYLKDGFSSLYKYCLRKLKLSESESFSRMTAAGIARRFPIVLTLLEQREIHLSGLCLLSRFLTSENHRELLEAACGKTKAQIDELLAERFPGKHAEERIRRLKARVRPVVALPPKATAASASVSASVSAAGFAEDGSSPRDSVSFELRNGSGLLDSDGAAGDSGANAPATPGSAASPLLEATVMDPETGEVTTVAQAGVGSSSTALTDRGAANRAETPKANAPTEIRYRIQFDASARVKAKLDQARALSSHANPRGELELLVERALDAYIEQLQKRRFAKTERPGEKSKVKRVAAPEVDAMASVENSRSKPPKIRMRRLSRRGHLASADRRTVAERCDLRCSFVSSDGQRCEERGFLQFHHVQSWARWGGDDADNLSLLCASHNRWLAEQELGAEHIARCIAEQRSRGSDSGPVPENE